MKLKVIGGIFDQHGALNRALDELVLRGLPYEAYSIVGRAGTLAADRDPQRAQGLMRALARLGLSGAQADFYVSGILNGGMLLVLHGIEASQFNQVHDMLQRQGARFAR